jgi:hypothetical protein
MSEVHTRHGKTVRVRLRGVNVVRRYRKDRSFAIYYYHRATGTQLQGQPGKPEFIASYAAAEKQLQERAKGTIFDLMRRFEASPAFDLADTTKLEYRRKFRIIERRWGSAPIASFESKEFKRDALDWRDAIAMRGAKREADNLMSALARLGSWALSRGEISINVLDKVQRVYRSDRADKIWLPEHVVAFHRVASHELVTALMLAMHTGAAAGRLAQTAMVRL